MNRLLLRLTFLLLGLFAVPSGLAQTLYIGNSSSDQSLSLTSGTNSYASTIVGNLVSDSNNFLTVSGLGTLLTNSLFFEVGVRGSQNSMVISNGGQVVAATAYISVFTNSSNDSVLVTDPGSLWSNSSSLIIGAGNGNSLVVSNGGTVVAQGLVIGNYTNSANNSVLVTGPGSLLLNSYTTTIGAGASGNSLVISNGGVFIGTSIATIAGNSSVLVTGTNSAWTIGGNLTIGNSSANNNSSMVISNGGVVTASSMDIGYSTSTNDSVLVTGPGSLLTNSSGAIRIGYSPSGTGGQGTLTVANGGAIAFPLNGQIKLAVNTGSVGTLNIGSLGGTDTAGSLINVRTIGFGSGTATINFNQVDTASIASLITLQGSINQLGSGTTILSGSNNITGVTTVLAGTLDFVAATSLYSGDSNRWTPANIIVQSNATVIFNVGTAAANPFTGNNIQTLLNNLVINSANTGFEPGSTFAIDANGTNFSMTNLIISNPINFIVVGGTMIFTGGSLPSLTANGGNITVSYGATVSGLTTVASSGTSTLTLTGLNGTFMGNGGLILAQNSNSAGTLNIGTYGGKDIIPSNYLVTPSITSGSGTGTINFNQITSFSLTNSLAGNLTVAQLGSGTTVISGNNSYSGTTVVGAGTLVVGSANALGSSTLTLNGGTFTSQTNFTLPSLVWNSKATLSVASFITLTATAPINQLGSNNLLSVVGNNAILSDSDDLTIGYSGNSNSMVISNSGMVRDINATLGATASSSSNSALVTGSHSLWTNSGTLTIGSFGQGSVTLVNAGTVAGTNIIIASGSGSVGTLNIGSFHGTNSAGVINVQNISFGSGTGTINFNQADSSTLTSSISGNGTVAQLGSGTSIISGNNSYSGSTLLNAGTLVGGSANAFGSSAVTLNGGTLTIQTNSTISSLVWNSGATLSLATPNASLTVAADISQLGNNNLVSVSASGAALSNGNLGFAYSGSGNRMVISGGGAVNDINGFIGIGAFLPSTTNSYNNSVLVSGSGSIWSNSNGFFVSGNSNSIVISNGGTVSDTIAELGTSTNSANNSVLVSGSGSLWTSSIALYVGYDKSSNSMTITNGATVASATGYVGFWMNSSNNTVLITGANSLWTNSGTLNIGGWTNSGPQILGGDGQGTVTVANGGTLAATNIVIAIGSASIGTLNIGSLGGNDTAGFINAPLINIGSGTGTINFNQSDSTFLTSSITGPGSINQLGSGTTILTGSNNIATTRVDGGTLAVSGTLANTNTLTLGNTNNGTLIIKAGGKIEADAGIMIASNSGSVGTLNVGTLGGADRIISNAIVAPIISFGGGSGTINFNQTNSYTLTSSISGPGSINQLGSGTTILSGSNNIATTTVDGGTFAVSGTFNNTTTLTVGNTNSGTLIIKTGGNIAAAALMIASNSGSTGTLNIGSLAGNDTAVTISSPAITFGNGTGTINFNQSDATTLISSITGNGSINQLGSGTTILSGSNSYIGITKVNAGTLEFANKYSLYNGDSSQWTAANITGQKYATIAFNVGTTGDTPFTADDITTLLNNLAIGSTNSGLEPGSIFGINATGTNFNFTNNLPSSIGVAALGGTLSFSGTNTLQSMVVNGGSSEVSGYTILQSNLTVGTAGSGMITMKPGAVFADQNGFIDDDPGSTGTVTVDSSLWSNSGTVLIGNSGTATLNIIGTGVVVADAGVTIAQNSNSTGTLNFGAFGRTDSIATNVLVTPSITFGSGTGAINFNQANSYTLTSTITGPGSISLLGSGTTILTGSNSYTGPTTVSSGTLLVGNTRGSATGLGTLTVNENALLGGSGTIGGDAIINGNLTPGNGTNRGLISFGGNLTFASNAVTILTLNPGLSTNSVAGIGYDAVKVTRTLTYNGTLELVDYSPTVGIFDLFGVSSILGNFKQVALGGSWFTLSSGIWTLSGNTYDWAFDPSSGNLAITMVPEPSTNVLLGLGVLLLVIEAWRLKHRREASIKAIYSE